MQGDAAGYRRACTGMLERFGRTGSPNNLAWACSIAPDALVDPVQAVQLAERAYAQAKDSITRNTLGAALYRAGRFDEAVEKLNQNEETHGAFDWFFLAMAHQRLGHAEPARHFLDKALAGFEQYTQPNAKVPWWRDRSLTFDQRLELQLLRREAETLIKGPMTDTNR
jgi:tetratricopeptide (TPR) repeat protein